MPARSRRATRPTGTGAIPAAAIAAWSPGAESAVSCTIAIAPGEGGVWRCQLADMGASVSPDDGRRQRRPPDSRPANDRQPRHVLEAATAVAETPALAGAVAEEVELGAPGVGTPDHLELRDHRRVERELPLDPDVLDDAADRKHLVDAAAL